MFNLNEICSDVRPVHSVQDAFDAVGYFQLALAAALEDQANPEALYVVYMKLAEIHCNHMPDAQLCQVYRDRAQGLKRILAGEEGSANGENNIDFADTEPGNNKEKDLDADMVQAESLFKRNNIFDSTPEDKCYEDAPVPRTFLTHVDTECRCIDTNLGDAHGEDDHNHHRPEIDGPYVDGSETYTIASQSYSDSIFTESFDTAKEQISDSSTSTDTLQTYQNPTDWKDPDFANDNSMPTHMHSYKPTGDMTGHTDARDTEYVNRDELNTPVKETEAHAGPTLKDVSLEGTQPGTDHTETVSMNPEKAVSLDNCCDYTERDKSETDDMCSEHMNLDDVYT